MVENKPNKQVLTCYIHSTKTMQKIALLSLLWYPTIAQDVASADSNAREANPCDYDDEFCCNETIDPSGCALDQMMPHERVYVNTDTETTGCLTGSDYRFEVTPGRRDKLMVYFQGGGGCWDVLTSSFDKTRLCTEDAYNRGGAEGVLNHAAKENPYKDWTIVHVLYCSGDTHVGNAIMPYNDFGSSGQIVHSGAANFQAVHAWIVRQSFELTDLLIMGCSAGSAGAQFLSPILLNSFPTTLRAAVVFDSLSGVGKAPFDAKILKNSGLCNTNVLDWQPSQALKTACFDNKLSLPMVADALISAFPRVQFLAVNSKTDQTQLKFYIATGLEYLTKLGFYNRLSEVLSDFERYPNFASYLVDGETHCFTNKALVYHQMLTEDAQVGTQVSLLSYLQKLPLHDNHETMPSQCYGKTKDARPELSDSSSDSSDSTLLNDPMDFNVLSDFPSSRSLKWGDAWNKFKNTTQEKVASGWEQSKEYANGVKANVVSFWRDKEDIYIELNECLATLQE